MYILCWSLFIIFGNFYPFFLQVTPTLGFFSINGVFKGFAIQMLRHLKLYKKIVWLLHLIINFFKKMALPQSTF